MKSLTLGIGCRRHVTVARIEAAVHVALTALGLSELDTVRAVATLDTKTEETALLDFCARYRLRLTFFTRAQVAACADYAALPSAPSAATRGHMGLSGVCEPCALLAARAGRIVVPKLTRDGVTLAVARDICARTDA